MHNTSTSCSKVISVDKYLFETNLMVDVLVILISSLQREGNLGPIQIFLTRVFWKKSNGFKPLTIFLKTPPS